MFSSIINTICRLGYIYFSFLFLSTYQHHMNSIIIWILSWYQSIWSAFYQFVVLHFSAMFISFCLASASVFFFSFSADFTSFSAPTPQHHLFINSSIQLHLHFSGQQVEAALLNPANCNFLDSSATTTFHKILQLSGQFCTFYNFLHPCKFTAPLHVFCTFNFGKILHINQQAC